jgi:hypothetical protein
MTVLAMGIYLTVISTRLRFLGPGGVMFKDPQALQRSLLADQKCAHQVSLMFLQQLSSSILLPGTAQLLPANCINSFRLCDAEQRGLKAR